MVMNLSKFSVAFTMTMLISLFTVAASAQTLSVKVGKDNEKTEKPKEKPADKPSEKPSVSLEHELKRVFGMKSETSLSGPRIENLGKYFLDKYTGEVSLVSYYRNEPVRWRILRDNVPEDIIYDSEVVNYQLLRFGKEDDDVVLLNINTGAMWGIDFKGISFNHKNTRLKYIPMIDTTW